MFEFFLGRVDERVWLWLLEKMLRGDLMGGLFELRYACLLRSVFARRCLLEEIACEPLIEL